MKSCTYFTLFGALVSMWNQKILTEKCKGRETRSTGNHAPSHPPTTPSPIRRNKPHHNCRHKDNYDIIPASSALIRTVMLYLTRQEMLQTLGASIRSARLADNLSLETLAARSGISVSALRNLENGKNASTVTLLEVCRTLRRTDWILNIAPPEINDALFDRAEPKKRLRASPRRKTP